MGLRKTKPDSDIWLHMLQGTAPTHQQDIARSPNAPVFAPCDEGMEDWIDKVKGMRRRFQRYLDDPDPKDDQGHARGLRSAVVRPVVPLAQLRAQCQ